MSCRRTGAGRLGPLLHHPADLVAWRRWHEFQHPLRHGFRVARLRLRVSDEAQVDVLTPAGDADVLVAVEATHSSFQHSVVAPLTHLIAERTAVVVPVGWQPPRSYARHRRSTITVPQLATRVRPRAVLAAGHFTEIGAAAFAVADERNIPFLVSQHGALTPFAPPLPRAAQLLAWSQGDGDFWTAGRADVSVTVTGSQLLWRAGNLDSDRPANGGRLTYLGQGHASEIRRRRLVEAALLFCREHGAVYRPHPSEKDRVSLMTLDAYRRAGVVVDAEQVPLNDLTGPVVSVFSTGVLEAAARGSDAWVDFPRPPVWLGEFWERYGMSRFGFAPTPTTAPARPDLEPARRIAEIVMEAAR